jgi:hypothetical protein
MFHNQRNRTKIYDKVTNSFKQEPKISTFELYAGHVLIFVLVLQLLLIHP